MKTTPLIIILLLSTLITSLLAGCSTPYADDVRDAGREVHSSDGYNTVQQSIRF